MFVFLFHLFLFFSFSILVSCVGIIPARYIAGVMNARKFAAALIKETTQVVLMEELTPECLGCDDAKRILQGKCLTNNSFHGRPPFPSRKGLHSVLYAHFP